MKLAPGFFTDVPVNNFLLHSESGGCAHSVSVEWQEDGVKALVHDGSQAFNLSREALLSAIAGGIDMQTTVFLELVDTEPQEGLPICYAA